MPFGNLPYRGGCCTLRTRIETANRGLCKHHPLEGKPFDATFNSHLLGGEDGIRTHGSNESPVFKTGSLNRSDTSPGLAGLLILKPAKHLRTSSIRSHWINFFSTRRVRCFTPLGHFRSPLAPHHKVFTLWRGLSVRQAVYTIGQFMPCN